jgi:diguanylate cyclase (GGDEF)-like protein
MAQSSLQNQVMRTEAHNLKLQQAVERLNRLSGSDMLTGLMNRRKIEEVLTQEFERSHRYGQALALIFIDIDHFKAVNDRLGHDTGDKVLAQVATRIQEALRVTDVVARWGGEEFLVVCPGTALDTAAALAERLRQTVAQSPIETAGHITVSAGVTQVQPRESWQACFRRLDASLYRAKSSGRDQVHLA